MKLRELLNVVQNNQQMIQLLNAKDHGFLECVEVKELLNPHNDFGKYLECEIYDMYSEEIEGDTQITIELVFVTYPEFMHKGQLYSIVELKPHSLECSLDLYGIIKYNGDYDSATFVDLICGEDEPKEMVKYAKELIDTKLTKSHFLKGELEKLIEDDYNPSAYGFEEDKEEAKRKQNLCKMILQDIIELL